jgi:hypothetical protein
VLSMRGTRFCVLRGVSPVFSTQAKELWGFKYGTRKLPWKRNKKSDVCCKYSTARLKAKTWVENSYMDLDKTFVIKNVEMVRFLK